MLRGLKPLRPQNFAGLSRLIERLRHLRQQGRPAVEAAVGLPLVAGRRLLWAGHLVLERRELPGAGVLGRPAEGRFARPGKPVDAVLLRAGPL